MRGGLKGDEADLDILHELVLVHDALEVRADLSARRIEG